MISLDPQDVARIDLLEDYSYSDKHDLRLLLHCLACFKSMQANEIDKELPNMAKRLDWCLLRSPLKDDPDFQEAFLEQLAISGELFEQAAKYFHVRPLELLLEHLIEFRALQK